MLLRRTIALVVLAFSSWIGPTAADAPAATADGAADLARELGLTAAQAARDTAYGQGLWFGSGAPPLSRPTIDSWPHSFLRETR